MMRILDLEYGGGLGDVFNNMYRNNSYNRLNQMMPGQRARVVLVCHNPHARELFTGHPKADQIELLDLGYYTPLDEEARRKEYNLPPKNSIPPLPNVPTEQIVFFPLPEDLPVLEALPAQPFVVIAATAGMVHRDLPVPILKRICARLAERNIKCVFSGRNYERIGGRRELTDLDQFPGAVINCIDKLTVPGTCELVRRSIGIVTCHSALAILGGHMNKPMLLLYEESVKKQHFLVPDEWSIGTHNGWTVHGLFQDYGESMQATFEALCQKECERSK